MPDIFSAQDDAFRALMVGTGNGITARSPGVNSMASAENDDSWMVHSCECAGGAPCAGCGGNISTSSPAYQALEWGAMTAQRVQDPLMRTATIAQALRDAPSRSNAPEWAALDAILQRTMDFSVVARQGMNASDALNRLAASFPTVSVQSSHRAESQGSISPSGPLTTLSAFSRSDILATLIDVTPSWYSPVSCDKTGTCLMVSSQCCCIAKDVYISDDTVDLDPPTPENDTNAPGRFISSSFAVSFTVGEGDANSEPCTIKWEEFTTVPYPAGASQVPAWKIVDLSNHPILNQMAANARAQLKVPCGPVSIDPIRDIPGASANRLLAIKVTLTSGCDSTSKSLYIVQVINDNHVTLDYKSSDVLLDFLWKNAPHVVLDT